MNKRQRRMWIARHKEGFENFWIIAGFLMFILILGIAGKMEYQSCLKGVC